MIATSVYISSNLIATKYLHQFNFFLFIFFSRCLAKSLKAFVSLSVVIVIFGSTSRLTNPPNSSRNCLTNSCCASAPDLILSERGEARDEARLLASFLIFFTTNNRRQSFYPLVIVSCTTQ